MADDAWHSITSGPFQATQPVVATINVEEAVKQGRFVKIEADELRPNAANEPLFASKDDEGKPLPIYLRPRLGMEPGDAPQAAKMTGDDGKPFIVTNEGYHKWTEAYVRDNLMPTEAEYAKPGYAMTLNDFMATLKKDSKNTPEDQALLATIEQNHQRFEGAIQKILQDKNAGEVHVMVGGPVEDSLSQAGSATTKEGKHYVFLGSSSVVEAFSDPKMTEAFIAVSGHEVAHIVNGHTTAAGILAQRDIEVTKRAETLADLDAQQPEGLAAYLKKSLTDNLVPAYNSKHKDGDVSLSSPSLQDLKQVSDWHAGRDTVHPPVLDRIAALEIQSALTTAYENRTPPATQADREAEHQWINKQILQQIDTGTLPEPASLKTAKDAIPDHVKALVQGMQPLPMKETDTHTAPTAAPATPVKEVQGPSH